MRAGWTLAWIYARRELRGGLKGFRVFLACLALGVAAIAAVQSVSRSVLDALERDGRILLGGDVSASVMFQPATPEQRAWFDSRGDVGAVAESHAMVRAGDGAVQLVDLKAVDTAYPLAGRFEIRDLPDAGIQDLLAARGGTWGMVVEDTVLIRLGLELGDRLTLGTLSYEVRGVVGREPDRTSPSGFSLAPRALVALDSLPETGLLQPGALVTWSYRQVLRPGLDPGEWKRQFDAAFPSDIWRTRVATDAPPQVERFVNRLTLFLTLVGLAALLIGGVGVGNAVRAYLDGKIATVATLKCLGAPDRFVFRLYFLQILILTTLGVAIGLAVGAAVPVAALWALGEHLPVAADASVYPGALAVAAGFGLLTALAFSLWPLARARAVPGVALFRDLVAPQRARARPLDAVLPVLAGLGLAALAVATAEDRLFAAWFVAGAAVALLLFRLAAFAVVWLARHAGRPRRATLRLAVANLHRPGNATGSVLLSLGLGLTVLVAVALIEGNFARQVSESLPEDAPSFFFIDIQPDQLERFEATVLGLPGARDLERVPSLRGRISLVNGIPAAEAVRRDGESWVLRGDRGITYLRDLPDSNTVVAGEWWPADYTGPPLISVYSEIAEVFELEIGDTMAVNVLGRDIEATVASFRDIDWGSLGINFAIVLSPGILEGAPQTWIATVKVPPEQEIALQRTVAEAFPNVTAIRLRDAFATVGDLIGKIGAAVRATAAFTLVAGMLVLAGAVAAGHRRRVYDAVVLKVLGATRWDVLRAYLLEYGLMGLAAAAIASLVGSIAAWAVLTQVMEAEFVLIPRAVATTAAVATAITLAFGFAGTWRALGHKAAPLLRND